MCPLTHFFKFNLKVRVFRKIGLKNSESKYIIRFIYFFGIKEVAGFFKFYFDHFKGPGFPKDVP